MLSHNYDSLWLYSFSYYSCLLAEMGFHTSRIHSDGIFSRLVIIPRLLNGKAFSKVQLPPDIVKPSRLIESPALMLWSRLCSCSHFKQALKPCYMYDALWVRSKDFRFIIKWMKRYLCESKLIQMCTSVSWHLCLRRHESKFDLLGFYYYSIIKSKHPLSVCLCAFKGATRMLFTRFLYYS